MNWGKLKEFRLHFILAIGAAILVTYCIDPLIQLLSKLFVVLSQSVSSIFLDSLYAEVGRGSTDYAFQIMGIMNFAIIMWYWGLIVVYIKLTIEKNRKKSVKDINEEKPEKSLVKKEPDVKQEKINFKFLMSFFGITLTLVGIIFLVGSHIKNSAIKTFDQEIKILTPYIDLHEKDLLISEFSLIQSYKDYQKLKVKIHFIAKSKNINLPKQSYINNY